MKNSARVGRPPKTDSVEDEDDEDEETTVGGRTMASSSSSPSLFSLDRQADPATFRSLDMARHPSITPTTRRGRPPRKRRGPKPRLLEMSAEGLTQLSVISRLADAPLLSESSDEEDEDDEDDDDDDDDEEGRACSPPILTKPAIGHKYKVR